MKASIEDEQGDKKKALLTLAKSLPIDENNAEAYCRVGKIFLELGQPQKALPFLKKGLRISPNHKGLQNCIITNKKLLDNVPTEKQNEIDKDINEIIQINKRRSCK